MRCPKCNARAKVVNSIESSRKRKRQYKCSNCGTYIYTCESIVHYYTPDEETVEKFKRQGTRKNE